MRDWDTPDKATSGGRGGRIFGHGGLRLVLLQFISDKPSHGYELIKAIEERVHGAYSPSPGVVYPTLTLLEELGHVTATAEGARKRFAITEEGRGFLAANRNAVDALLARMNETGPAGGRPPQVIRAIENLRLAVRMRLARAPLTEAQIDSIADALDAAARQIEKV
jgi:DNA-binding PadR family transcriptional regulator